MRAAGNLLALTMQEVLNRIEPGAKDGDVDRFAEEFIRSHGALPAFKGYNGYPKTLCMSFNEQVVHGIPGNRRIKEGDLIGIDCGVILNEYYSDMARSVYVGGEPPRRIKQLMEATQSALASGIENMREGKRLGDVSSAVQTQAEAHGFSVVRSLVGHGIGTSMHEEPQVPNYGSPGTGPEIKNGMVFAIEPMVNMGRYAVKTLPDGWTIVTADNSLSCHFENTVAATPDGPEILSRVQSAVNI
jgi:methionyl aminopeptidase